MGRIIRLRTRNEDKSFVTLKVYQPRRTDSRTYALIEKLTKMPFRFGGALAFANVCAIMLSEGLPIGVGGSLYI